MGTEEAPATWSARKGITIQMKGVAPKCSVCLVHGKQWGSIARLRTLMCC